MDSLKKNGSLKLNWWDELPPVISCPECGKKAMRRANGPCQLLDGTLIPQLERFHCFSCDAEFFDDVAMGIIDKFRKSVSAKPSHPRRRTRVKGNLVAQ
jgi:hypothetical protein